MEYKRWLTFDGYMESKITFREDSIIAIEETKDTERDNLAEMCLVILTSGSREFVKGTTDQIINLIEANRAAKPTNSVS